MALYDIWGKNQQVNINLRAKTEANPFRRKLRMSEATGRDGVGEWRVEGYPLVKYEQVLNNTVKRTIYEASV